MASRKGLSLLKGHYCILVHLEAHMKQYLSDVLSNLGLRSFLELLNSACLGQSDNLGSWAY